VEVDLRIFEIGLQCLSSYGLVSDRPDSEQRSSKRDPRGQSGGDTDFGPAGRGNKIPVLLHFGGFGLQIQRTYRSSVETEEFG
jgi:hypothetical protein